MFFFSKAFVLTKQITPTDGYFVVQYPTHPKNPSTATMYVLLYLFLENSPNKILVHANWLKIVFVWHDGDSELARAVDVIMAWAKIIYILMIKVNKLCFSSRSFLKEIGNMFSVFLSSYANTRETLGELEKAVKISSQLSRIEIESE